MLYNITLNERFNAAAVSFGTARERRNIRIDSNNKKIMGKSNYNAVTELITTKLNC